MADTTNQIARIKLTAAELEFLVGQDPAWPAVRESLNGVAPDSPQVVAAGLCSLLARDLARPNEAEIQVLQPVLDYARRLVHAQHRIGITLMTDDRGMAPAVYCVGSDGERTLVSVEAPGVIALQAQAEDELAVDQAMALVNKAAAVPDAVIAIKVPGVAAVIFRRQGEAWELGDPAEDATNFERFFKPTSRDTVLGAARAFLSAQLA